MTNSLLLVDDNDRYARLLEEYFEPRGYGIDRAYNAAEGLEKYQAHDRSHYRVIVTDITMETQTAGISMLRKINKSGYKGTVVIASTGFDVPTSITLSRLLLRSCGADYLVRKTTVLQNAPEFWPMRFFAGVEKEFSENRSSSSARV